MASAEPLLGGLGDLLLLIFLPLETRKLRLEMFPDLLLLLLPDDPLLPLRLGDGLLLPLLMLLQKYAQVTKPDIRAEMIDFC